MTIRNAVVKMLVASLALAVLTSIVFGQELSPDLILFNGKVFTSNPSQPYVEAIAVRGERIVAVGTSKEIVSLAGHQTKQMDLGGRTVIPGINDAHTHLGVSPHSYDLPIKSFDPRWQEIKDALTAAVKTVPKGTWIVGKFGSNILDDPQATRAGLDAIAPDYPVVLVDWTSHASLMNTAALRKLGVQEDEPNPVGGSFVRNPANGQLTGMVFEFAQFRLGRRFNELASDQEAVQQLHEYFDGAARQGITTVQDMASSISAERCVALFEKAPPLIRVRIMWLGLTDRHGRMTQEGRVQSSTPVPLVTVSGTKWILDGTPIEHSAAMRKPYADRPTSSGELDFSQQEMEAMLRESLQSNDQLMVHVVGDRTVETFLNAMDATGGEKVWSKRRVRFEHGDGVMPDLMPRAKRLRVIVVVNPAHFTSRESMVKTYGEKRGQEFLPLRSLLDSGIPVAIGSDGPNNPFLNIMFASTYPGNPKESVTREQAVIACTQTSAFAEFAEKDKGSLEPGKLADLAVLSQDVFKIAAGDLPKTESVLTMVGGNIVFDAKVIGVH